MKFDPHKRGDIVNLEGEELEFVVYHVGKDKLGVFPRYKVDDVDDRRWNEKELDWEVIGKRPLTLPEWYNPAARFDNEEAVVKYGVTFRQHVTCDQVLEVIHSVGDAPPEIGDWVLVDEEEHGLISGVVDGVQGASLSIHFTHHKCAATTGHWDADVDSADILLTDSTYRGSYEQCNCLHN